MASLRARSEEQEQGALDGFLGRYPADDRAQDYLLSSPPEVVERVIRDFRPRVEGEADYSGLLTSFVKRVRQQCSEGGGSGQQQDVERGAAANSEVCAHDLRRTVDKFCRRYPVDDDAYSCLAKCRTDIALKVMREFHPPREGEADYSALLRTFVKRCNNEAPVPQHGGTRGGDIARRGDKPTPPGGSAGARPSALDNFLRKYPVDDRASEYLRSSPAEVQERVVLDFRPKREGEADYSSLLTSFVTRCRQDSGRSAVAAEPQRQGSADGAALEDFRARHPMDDRAFEYLATSPAEVQKHVLSTFEPRRLHDHDYSAPVTAYIRECRKFFGFPGSSAVGVDTVPSSHHVADRAPAAAQERGRHRSRRGHELEDPLSDDCREPEAVQGELQEVLASFLEKYPVDTRAYEYLANSTADVIWRVVQEFEPRRKGESDYSALVTTFVKRCRELPSRGHADQIEPPWKRARAR
mmetsp:Transcript_59429/g.173917  ORF Transcript_59429/g.173917 Transcript_59429/m.173917 type:complete len:468 (-) Transcript_59429:90-1493(-)